MRSISPGRPSRIRSVFEVASERGEQSDGAGASRLRLFHLADRQRALDEDRALADLEGSSPSLAACPGRDCSPSGGYQSSGASSGGLSFSPATGMTKVLPPTTRPLTSCCTSNRYRLPAGSLPAFLIEIRAAQNPKGASSTCCTSTRAEEAAV